MADDSIWRPIDPDHWLNKPGPYAPEMEGIVATAVTKGPPPILPEIPLLEAHDDPPATTYMMLSAHNTYGRVEFHGEQPHWMRGRSLADEWLQELFGDDYCARYVIGSSRQGITWYSVVFMGKGSPDLKGYYRKRKAVKL